MNIQPRRNVGTVGDRHDVAMDSDGLFVVAGIDLAPKDRWSAMRDHIVPQLLSRIPSMPGIHDDNDDGRFSNGTLPSLDG